ncbi:P-type conjugative transfer protein TrbG [Novosphingobium terrae]|uniref:P-type conjugative transfer protein TrbG n=1 Tax=Novosphingobium terrae TaxID=2726189 RepID=UPI00197D9DEA|nr:P-type conjugative transfer protein TrbG [Novosphingobium terrae]
MSALFYLTGLIVAAAAAAATPAPVTATPQQNAPAPTHVAAPTAPASAKPGSGPTITPLPVVPVKAWHRHHRVRPHLTSAEISVRAANQGATQDPQVQGFMNALQVYNWGEGVIYHLLAAPGRVSDLILQPGEAITSIAAGDTARWTIGDTSSGSGEAKRVHVLVKPFSAGLSTNLVIATDRRTYHLQLTSTVGTAMAGISWSYPADELLAVKHKEAEAQAIRPVAAGLDVQSLTFAYAISGDTPAWRPLRAFDDGRQTFIEFPPSIAVGEAPPLFVLGAKGATELVNYRMSGRYYVVDRLFAAAELRLGGKQQAVVRITRGATADKDRHSDRRAS